MGNDKNKKLLKYLLCIIPFFIPDIFNYKFHKIVTILRLFQILIFLIFLIQLIKKGKFSKFLKYTIVYVLVLFIITFISGGDIYYNLKNSISILGFCLVCEMAIQENYKVFIATMFFYFTILNVINFSTILLFPRGMYLNNSGMYNNWFLGYKNAHILYVFPWILFYILKTYEEKGKFSKKTYIFILLSLAFSIFVDSGTATITLFLLLLFLFFRKKFNNVKILTMKNLFLVILLLFLALVIFRIQNFLSIFLINLLNRSITFTGRTLIWDYALLKIKDSFLIGYGDNAFIYNPYILSTHNQFLGILFETGIVGFILYLILLYILIRKIDSIECNKQVSFYSKCFVFLYLFMMLMEEHNMRHYIYVFVIIYNLCLIKKENKQSKENLICEEKIHSKI